MISPKSVKKVKVASPVRKSDSPTKVQHYYFDPNRNHPRELNVDFMFFDQLRERLKSIIPDFNAWFNEFFKVLYLYYHSVITLEEFVNMLTDVEYFKDIQKCSYLEPQETDEIQAMIHSRINSRRIQTQLFKPLKDTDFSGAQRVTRSYVAMHPGYANKTSPNQTQKHILNQKWVSVPFGSEDYSFSIMRKNTFEEQLFKSEDERFDFDFNIIQMRRTMHYLQNVIDSNDPQKCKQDLDKAINFKFIAQLYRNVSQDQEEIIKYLQSNPIGSAKVVLKRIQAKYQEFISIKNSKAKSIWEQVALTNFHRSLDHRSFYFKRNDKMFTVPSRFIKEPEERLKVIMQHVSIYNPIETTKKKADFHFEIQQLEQYTNSLTHLTNVEPPLKQKQCPLIPPLTQQNCLKLPLFALWMGNSEILNDTLQFLLHYTWVMGGSNIREKKYITRLIVKISNAVLNVGLTPIDLSQLTLNETQLRQDIVLIEKQITNIVATDSQSLLESKKKKTQDNNNSHESSQIQEELVQQINPDTQADGTSDQVDNMNPVFVESQFEKGNNEMLDYLPKSDNGNTLYVSHPVYVFIRFVLSIYQRMELAQHISCTKDANEEPLNLNEEEKEIFGKKRYQLFKSTLFLSLKAKDFKYEDYLKSLFGKLGFLFSTLEKLLTDTCKHLAASHAYKITSSTLQYSLRKCGDTKQYFKTIYNACQAINAYKVGDVEPYILYSIDQGKTEEMQVSNLAYMLMMQQERTQEKPIFRVKKKLLKQKQILNQDNTIFINALPACFRILDRTELLRSLGYVQDMTQTYKPTVKGTNKVFLNKNLRRACRPREIISRNSIVWTVGDQCQMVQVPNSEGEDEVLCVNRKPRQTPKKNNTKKTINIIIGIK